MQRTKFYCLLLITGTSSRNLSGQGTFRWFRGDEWWNDASFAVRKVIVIRHMSQDRMSTGGWDTTVGHTNESALLDNYDDWVTFERGQPRCEMCVNRNDDFYRWTSARGLDDRSIVVINFISFRLFIIWVLKWCAWGMFSVLIIVTVGVEPFIVLLFWHCLFFLDLGIALHTLIFVF